MTEGKCHKVFDEILSKKATRAICKRCGNYQTHGAVYCSRCGAKYTYYPDTYLDSIKAMYNRQYQDRPFFWYPGFVAALWKRLLQRECGEDGPKLFEAYLWERLKESDTAEKKEK